MISLRVYWDDQRQKKSDVTLLLPPVPVSENRVKNSSVEQDEQVAKGLPSV